jgi:hypothetical protein
MLMHMGFQARKSKEKSLKTICTDKQFLKLGNPKAKRV